YTRSPLHTRSLHDALPFRSPSLLALPHDLKGRPLLRENRHRKSKLVLRLPSPARPPSLLALPHALKGRPLLRKNRHRKSKLVSGRPGLARLPSLWDLPPDLREQKTQIKLVVISPKIRNRGCGVRKNEMYDHLLMIKFHRAEKIIPIKILQISHDFPIFIMFLGLNYVKRRKTSVHYSSNQHSQ